MPEIVLTCEDNMALMSRYPDKHFNLAIVDPPYGIGINMNQGRRSGQIKRHKDKKWDNCAPKIEYWQELKRVSKNQIVWGANNFNWLPAHNGGIVWDKDISGDVGFSKAEIAFCSLIAVVDIVRIRAQTGKEVYSNKIHPTQKPVALYKWLLANYAKPGDKILDTHLGSGSIAIACYDLGFDLVACELDADYYRAMMKRYTDHVQSKPIIPGLEYVGGEPISQQKLFEP